MDTRDPMYRDTVPPADEPVTDADMDGTEMDDSRRGDGAHHATTGGSALAGAVTGGIIGTAAGPLGTAVGAVGGAIVGAAAERVMHSDDDREGERMGLDNDRDANVMIEDREKEGMGTMDRGMTGYTGTDRGMGTTATGGQTVRVHEEELRPRKEMVETGQVEIRKDVVTEHRTVEVPVTREEVHVERHPVDHRPASEPIGRESETIRVPVREEQVTVEKRPVVTEEISVSKRPVTETREVSGTVRREEAHVEKTGTDTRMTATSATTMPGHEHTWTNGSCSCGARQPV